MARTLTLRGQKRSRGSEMTDYDKGRIDAYHDMKLNSTQIGHKVSRPASTIRSYLRKARIHGYQTLPRSGRPPKISARGFRILKRYILCNRKHNYTTVQTNTLSHVSIRTIQRKLQKELNMRKWLAKERPKLTAENAKKRLEWAKRVKDWTTEDWAKVGWSDECSIEKDKDPRQVWVFRTPQEKYQSECVRPKKTGRSISLMVWGTFAGNVKGPFLIFDGINGKVTAQYYLEQMQGVLPKFMEYIADTLDVDAIFMQDNAPIHKAEIVKNWLQEQDFAVMDWPPYSPDLNPIEQVWPALKSALQRQYPDIATMRGGPNTVKGKLAEVLPDIWRSLPEDLFQALCDSMPRRVAAIIANKGWYTKY
jgi:transposase